MKTNVFFITSLRKPFRSLLLLILFGLISFGFITKAVEFILVQSQTKVLGSYYRSIGVLENMNAPQSGDVSAGKELIETSPYFAYGDQRFTVSGVMQQTYNSNGKFKWSNSTQLMNILPKEQWFNVHATDRWFIGALSQKEEVKNDNGDTFGYHLTFNIDTLLAAYPEDARQGQYIGLLFMFEGNEAAIPLIQEMVVGQRYLIRSWEDPDFHPDIPWNSQQISNLQIIPLDNKQLWYIPLAQGASIDFSDPEMASIKNEIDILNENLHTLNIIATADMSAMPRTQEASRYYYLIEGRWLNHQDDLAGNKVIVVPNEFAVMRDFKLGDEITLTFRPLKDTFLGYIRDGVDQFGWRSYPTYQDTFTIVGLYGRVNSSAVFSYIPTSSLRPGFGSSDRMHFSGEDDYSFVLDSSRHQTKFIQAYKVPLQKLGISLTFLENNGQAYWAAVDPIRRSLSADLLVFGLLMVVALIMAVFLYLMQHKRVYAILRALGVTAKQASRQLILPLLVLGGLGIIIGGLSSWNYAIDQARATLSTLPTPAGIYPSTNLNLFILAGLWVAGFVLLALFSWLGVSFLANKPVYEILQGETSQNKAGQKRSRNSALGKPIPSLNSNQAASVYQEESTLQEPPVNELGLPMGRKYKPSSLVQYVIHHLLRSGLKTLLTLAVALGFMLALSWIRQTMEHSQLEINQLYDTTVVDADITQTIENFTRPPNGGNGFISRKTVDGVLNSGFVKNSILEADTTWAKIKTNDSQKAFAGTFPVYAYDSPETLTSSLMDPGSLIFASGWDLNLFAEQRTLEQIKKDGIPAIFPSSLLEQMQFKAGEVVRITDQFNNSYPCVIVGQYSGGRGTIINSIKRHVVNSAGDYIIISLSALESMEGSQTEFTVAHFILDPKKNRELSQFRTDMEAVMEAYGAGLGKLRLIIWDEELRIVIAQLDKNISLLKVLYPVLMAVSVLIGAGLCFLLVLQTTREVAIMRVLGTTRTAVRLALIVEPLILSIIGVIMGLVISRFLWMTSAPVQAVPLLSGAGLYLAGVLTGVVSGAILVTNKKPIDLLQVKE